MTFLARFSLGNRALVALATILAVAGGLWSTTTLKQELMPSLELPVVGVVTVLPGASPEIVEEQVTTYVEQATGSVSGLESTSSTSSANVSTVLLTLEYGTDATTAQQELQSALSRISSSLPAEADAQVFTGSLDDLPVLQLAVTADADPDATAAVLAESVVPQLEGVDGVRDVTLTGTAAQVVTIAVDPAALAAAGVGADAISTALTTNGIVVPAGSLTEGDTTLSVEVGQRLSTVEDIAALPLLTAAGPVRLDSVAQVSLDDAAATSFARTNGEPSFGIAITRAPNGNTVEISHAVQDLFGDLEAALGEGAEISIVFDQAPFIEQSVEDLTTEGLLGLAFAIIIILLFLRAWRPTGVTALSIPLSLLVALIGLKVGGFSLNLFTLAALTVSIGRVVDDAIVVIENIERHLSYGEDKRTAILRAVREVSGAITASTIATAAVFVPMGLVSGLVGELFRPFAFTVALALLASLLVALTIVPVLAWWFLPVPKDVADAARAREAAEDKERRGALQRGFVRALGGVLARPVVTVIGAVAVLAGTLALVPQLETEFIGDTGQNTVSVTQELPPGTSLAAQNEAAAQVEDVIAGIDGVETYQVSVGSAEGILAIAGGGGTTFSITLDLDADTAAVQEQLRDGVAGLENAGTVTVTAGQAGFSSGLEVIVSGPDGDAVASASEQVLDAVAGVDGTTDLASNLAADLPTVEVVVDRDAAAALGIPEAQVGQTVRAALSGATLGTLTTDAGTSDIVMQVGESPTSVAALRALPIAGAAGVTTLGEIATVEQVERPATITRLDGQRSATITAATTSADLTTQSADLQAALDGLELPDGVTAEIGGVSADQEEAFGNLGLALLLSIAIVYLVMVATFKSLVQPLILLISIPFAATGAIALLLITGTPLGVAGLIGALMLVGVVVTNAIVLIDLINQYRRQGRPLREAIIEGARHRLRPILMTALATIGALTPMAIGLTGGSAFISQPLALVVIGGLITSTFLTLLLVPVLYSLVEGRKERRAAARAGTDQRVGAGADAGPDGSTSRGKHAASDSSDAEAATAPVD
ncbi:efflux RND transporter permease subunit [Occultella aeris]|uniref:Swarming motility protein SwrC n=1 Tax=Occultella aeris TaxID=2761496 RepID=A0A7M4DNT4_9MICO|nr:efflux RND transporter permease subunit [Occultella aeris]VZO39115.1 Swarming motility protein SwrC [Occultella aeris]